jgi:hypothetical protein
MSRSSGGRSRKRNGFSFFGFGVGLIFFLSGAFFACGLCQQRDLGQEPKREANFAVRAVGPIVVVVTRVGLGYEFHLLVVALWLDGIIKLGIGNSSALALAGEDWGFVGHFWVEPVVVKSRTCVEGGCVVRLCQAVAGGILCSFCCTR